MSDMGKVCRSCYPLLKGAEAICREHQLEIALRGLVSAWREFGEMIVFNNAVNKDDYGFTERVEAVAKLVEAE